MARWLAARGHDVSLICWSDGRIDEGFVNGVSVLNMCRRDEGVPGLRFLYPRWTSLIAAMRRADADVYYQNCGEYVTGQVALWSRLNGRRFVYSVASDPDCMPDLPLMRTCRERVLYRYGLRNADRIIVQTVRQKRMLAEGFGLESKLIPMPCPGPGPEEYLPPAGGSSRVLWLGRIERVKRPDRFLDVVASCPDLKFDLVGPAGHDSYSQAILERARGYPNLHVHGPIPHGEVPGFLRKSACLCSTSDVEGFPNTFLEAWSQGIPVVSTVDPDGIILERGLGRVAADAANLALALRTLLGSSAEWRAASENARAYYLKNHHFDSVMPVFENLFMESGNTREN
jgi:glycosyltransferase involved in cell wall biosynthesis